MNLKSYLRELTNMNKVKIILIVGPTGVGKTKLSVSLAEHYNAEIINADSRYIYTEPLIATAKVTKSEMNNIKHHMIDIISLNDDYSIYNYQCEGRKILNSLVSIGKNIIIVGGSGLYIKSLLYDYRLNSTVKSNIDYSNFTNEELKNKINEIDENNQIHVNNRKRMERYLTYYNETGNTIKKETESNNKIYDFVSIGLETPRENLYNRINDRVEVMFNNGLLEEAIKLKDYVHFNEIIGYRELIPYFNNEIDLDTAKDNIKKDSRHYAKRQMTWFKNQMKDIIWLNTDYNDFNNTINESIKEIDKYYN